MRKARNRLNRSRIREINRRRKAGISSGSRRRHAPVESVVVILEVAAGLDLRKALVESPLRGHPGGDRDVSPSLAGGLALVAVRV